MSQSGYTETGRLVKSSNAAAAAGPLAMANVVPITIVNQAVFAARVVFLEHRHGDLDEHRVLVRSGQTINHYCAMGEVVIIVFNVDSNQFHAGYVRDVTGSFSFVIS